MRKLIALFCIASMLFMLAACSEGDYIAPEQPSEDSRTIQSAETPEIKQDIRINTDLLDDFGMTLAELEEKYGRAISGRDDKFVTDNFGGGEQEYSRFTYYFEGSELGYTFVGTTYIGHYEFDEEQRTLSDGTARISSDSVFGIFEGQVKDLFTDMEKEMTLEEFNKKYGVFRDFQEFRESRFREYENFNLISPKPDGWDDLGWDTGDWHSGFLYGNGRINFTIYIQHDDTVKPESVLQLFY
jgi:hypothetical protein